MQKRKLLRKQKSSPTKPENHSASTPMSSEKTDQSGTPSETSTQTSTTWSIQTCRTLKYGTFIQILLKNNPTFYKISKDNWKEILIEYSSLVATEKAKTIMTAYQRWFYTEWKINTLAQLLTFLKVVHDKDIAEAVQELGYDLVEFKEDREEYLKQIYLIENEAKTLVILRNQYLSEYKMLTGGETEEENDKDEMYYEKEIAIISKFMGFRIKKNKITVFEWAGCLNAYIEYHELDSKTKEDGGEPI